MPIPKGGRGVKAPYETTHMRIPIPLKDKIGCLVADYKLNSQGEFTKEQIGINEAVLMAQQILAQKRSARVSLEKLLTAIYGQTVKF